MVGKTLQDLEREAFAYPSSTPADEGHFWVTTHGRYSKTEYLLRGAAGDPSSVVVGVVHYDASGAVRVG